MATKRLSVSEELADALYTMMINASEKDLKELAVAYKRLAASPITLAGLRRKPFSNAILTSIREAISILDPLEL